MKRLFMLCLCIVCFSCKEASKSSVKSQEQSATAKITNNHIQQESFQKSIDSAHVKGAILIYDLKKDTYYSNDFSWAKTGQLPASTFKIPNSIIGLETKVVDDKQTIFKWNGEERFLKSWEADLTLQQAFQRSCVPCYQEVARKIGVKRMNQYLEQLQYGSIKVDSVNLESFWLQGNAHINMFQQIDFLKRLREETLPISQQTFAIVKKIMILKQTEKYTLRGKTGWSIEEDHHNGWFVGYVESGDQAFFFATNIEPISNTFDQKNFQKSRKELTYKALQQFNILL